MARSKLINRIVRTLPKKRILRLSSKEILKFITSQPNLHVSATHEDYALITVFFSNSDVPCFRLYSDDTESAKFRLAHRIELIDWLWNYAGVQPTFLLKEIELGRAPLVQLAETLK